MRQIIDIEGNVISPDLLPKVAKKELVKWLDIMIAVRVLDEKGMRLQRQGRIGFHIPTTGQEAHVGAAAAIKDKDWIFPAYREHGLAIYRGIALADIVNHLFANDLDPQKGRRLPGLFGDSRIRFINPSAPIGTQIVQAAGAGYAARYKKDGSVSIVFFGDGATSSNDFHSGMNFGAVTKAATVFICQNNQWAISVPLSKQTATKQLVDKATGYGMPGIQIDGNDIFAMFTAVREAAQRARKGNGPTFIESVTYRLGPHTSSDDPSKYRSENDVELWRQKEPIGRFSKYLINEGIIDKDEPQRIHSKYDQIFNELISEADNRSTPPLETMFEDVFETMPWYLEEQLEEALRFTKE